MNATNYLLIGKYTIIFWSVASAVLAFYCYSSQAQGNDVGRPVSFLSNVSMDNDSTSYTSPAGATSPSECVNTSLDRFLAPRLAHYKFAIFDTMDETEKFTIVMLTYKRVKTLPSLLLGYCQTRYLSKIVVIWNDVGAKIPQNILQVNNQCAAVPVVFVKETENKLTNRFKPRTEIETDCICVIDDDRNFKNIGDLEFAFRTWQHFRARIVGFEERTYTLQKNGLFWYGIYPGVQNPGYSIMGTGTALFHRAYMEMYFDTNFVPAEVLHYINNIMNCEDIWLNVIVSKFLSDVSWKQPGALVINPLGGIENLEGKAYYVGGTRGLSSRKSHYAQRTECLNKFATFFDGSLPLHYTYTRITH